MISESMKIRRKVLAKEASFERKNEELRKSKNKKKDLQRQQKKISRRWRERKKDSKYSRWSKNKDSMFLTLRRRIWNVTHKNRSISEKRKLLGKMFWSIFELSHKKDGISKKSTQITLSVLEKFTYAWLRSMKEGRLDRSRRLFSRMKNVIRPHRKTSKCFACGGDAELRHHIVLLCRGGDSRRANVIWLCRSCHSHLHVWIRDDVIWMNKLDKESSLDFCLA